MGPGRQWFATAQVTLINYWGVTGRVLDLKKGKLKVSWWLSRLEKGRGKGIRQWLLMGNDYNFFKGHIIFVRRRFATCVCVFVYEDASVLFFYFETGYPFLLDAPDQLVFCILWDSRPVSSWGFSCFCLPFCHRRAGVTDRENDGLFIDNFQGYELPSSDFHGQKF